MPAVEAGPDGCPVLHPREFERFRKLAYEHIGIDFGAGKEGLVAARLGKKLRQLGMESYAQYYDYVMGDASGEALAELVDYLTTNHTSFFREPAHFQFLGDTVLPALRQRHEIKIWSAACSSGEEPYSIAMTLIEAGGAEIANRVRIRASDISTRVLAKARAAVYPASRFEGVDRPVMQRYLLRGQSGASEVFRFKPEIRAMVEFERRNLMEELPKGYICSAIFCRNIMIYFDKPTQENLVNRLAERLEPGGYLFIGHSESLNAVAHPLEYVRPATYRKAGSLAGAHKSSQVGSN